MDNGDPLSAIAQRLDRQEKMLRAALESLTQIEALCYTIFERLPRLVSADPAEQKRVEDDLAKLLRQVRGATRDDLVEAGLLPREDDSPAGGGEQV